MKSRTGAWCVFLAVLLPVALLLGNCTSVAPEIEETAAPTQAEQAQLPNPASEHCAEQGGTLEIRMEGGGEVGYCQFADGSECEEWAFMRGECQPGQPVAEVHLPEPSEDIIARAAKLKPLDMSQSALLSGLAGWELAVLDRMKQAAAAMDAAYWQQVGPDDEALFRSLAGATDATEAAERLMLDANYGRWDRFDEFVPFLDDEPRPAGGYVYPRDLTKEDLYAYIAAHPDDKDGLLSPYTVVRRDEDRLVAVPYHEAYAEFVLPAADLLDQAAALSKNESLTIYLRLEAEALRTDEYFDADMAWLDLDSNLDISIGPHEVYDDQLTGQKAFYKANVLIVDRPAAEQLSALMAAIPALQARLPVPAAHRPDQTGTMTPLEIADDVYRAGQVRAIMEGVAFSLPNDPKVWEAKGAKKVMMGNYLDARRTEVLTPLANAILAEEAAQQLDSQTYFNWVLLHEVSHTLGPRTVEKNGEELTVSEALGEYYSPIEEGKADITGLYGVPYLLDEGILTGSLESHYVGYLAEALRSIRFGPGSAYGMIRSAAWNMFVERGALALDPAAGKFSVDVEKMTKAVEELNVTLLTIEGEGDTAAAKGFLDQYTYVALDLQALLDEANATVPVEFVPMYATEPKSDMLNPASEFCVEQGYELVIRDEAGGQVGYCLFPDGSECEEWAFYRGEWAPAGESQAAAGQLANPASENCAAVGGTWTIENRVGGGQFGICLFEDNRQCEEWALLRGDCPVGGVKVTGYVTPAAVYCAITGGEYAITGNGGAEDEQGTCTFKDGTVCDVWEYYDEECSPGSAGSTIEPLIEELCNGQAQAMSHALGDLIPTVTEEPLDDPVTGATGTGCQATITGTGVQFESPSAVVSALGSMLAEQGWTAAPMFVADGPTGTAAGYRKGDQICLAAAMWQPDPSANCPQDQPISACQVKPEQQLYTVTLNCGVETAEGQSTTPPGSGLLVFDSTRGGDYRNLYLMPAPGRQAQVNSAPLEGEIGRRLGVQVSYIDFPFDALLSAGQSGQIDIAISAISRTPE